MVHVRTELATDGWGAESRREAGRQQGRGNFHLETTKEGAAGGRRQVMYPRESWKERLRTQKLWRAGVRYGAAKEVRFWFA